MSHCQWRHMWRHFGSDVMETIHCGLYTPRCKCTLLGNLKSHPWLEMLHLFQFVQLRVSWQPYWQCASEVEVGSIWTKWKTHRRVRKILSESVGRTAGRTGIGFSCSLQFPSPKVLKISYHENAPALMHLPRICHSHFLPYYRYLTSFCDVNWRHIIDQESADKLKDGQKDGQTERRKQGTDSITSTADVGGKDWEL